MKEVIINLPEDCETIIKKFIVEVVGKKSVVIGLSGGIDSAVVTKLCVDALGRERVLTVHMPDDTTPYEDRRDARMLAETFNLNYMEIEIAEIVRSFVETLKISSVLSVGNLKSRIRMCILYGLANERDMLVAGTSNKSELLIGYFTKYGDGASDFLPIGDLYKTQVIELARRIGIPNSIIEKPPRAGLWIGQTDEDEIGVKYELLDKILYLIEHNRNIREIEKILGIDYVVVKKIWDRYNSSRHKRNFALIPKLSYRTIGYDWRE